MPAVGHPLSSLSRDKSGVEPSEKKRAYTRTMKRSREENRKEETEMDATRRLSSDWYPPFSFFSLRGMPSRLFMNRTSRQKIRIAPASSTSLKMVVERRKYEEALDERVCTYKEDTSLSLSTEEEEEVYKGECALKKINPCLRCEK